MVSTNPLKPSTSQGFETPTVEDLSHLAEPGFPSYGSSMGGNNTVSEKTGLLQSAAPGSPSEASTDAKPASTSPDLNVGTPVNHTKDVK